MGRKKLPEASLRHRKVYLRFTEEEYEKITRWFQDSSSRTVGEFCYRAIREARIITYNRVEIPADLRTEIKRIGNNINQAALVLNQQKGHAAAENALQILLQISRHLEALVKAQNTER